MDKKSRKIEKGKVENVKWKEKKFLVFVFLFLFLFCFVLFCFVLFCFVLFCFVLFCFVLFCFVLFCFVLFCVLFCFVFVWFVCLCFAFHFLKALKCVLGLPKCEFSTGKKHFTPGEKSGRTTLPLSEKYSSYVPEWCNTSISTLCCTKWTLN